MTEVSTRNIRGAWIGYNFSTRPAPDGTLLQITENAAGDFDTWLDGIRAAAWEEGREAGRSDTHDRPAPNPHLRKDQQ